VNTSLEPSKRTATPWEAEIDRLIEEQMSADLRAAQENLRPRAGGSGGESAHIFLASRILPAKNSIGNFHPAVLEPYVLWNVSSSISKWDGECHAMNPF